MNIANMNQQLELGIVNKNKLDHGAICQTNSPILVPLYVKRFLDLVCKYAAEHCRNSLSM
jgi:hypothetical protein